MKGQRQWQYNCWSSGPCSPQPCAALGALHYSHPLASGQSPCRRRLLLLLLCTTLHGRVSRAGERIHSIKTGSGDPMVQNLYHHRPAHHLKSVRAPWLWLLLWLEWALWFSPPVTLSPSPNYLISPTLGGEQSISPLGTPKRPIGLLALPNPSWFLFSFTKPLLVFNFLRFVLWWATIKFINFDIFNCYCCILNLVGKTTKSQIISFWDSKWSMRIVAMPILIGFDFFFTFLNIQNWSY